MNGVIASVEVLQTNAAAQGAAVFSIASTENVRVKVDISPDDYEKMTVGTPATITIGEHKYEGTLENVNRIATNNKLTHHSFSNVQSFGKFLFLCHSAVFSCSVGASPVSSASESVF